jgi:hypothetical protein
MPFIVSAQIRKGPVKEIYTSLGPSIGAGGFSPRQLGIIFLGLQAAHGYRLNEHEAFEIGASTNTFITSHKSIRTLSSTVDIAELDHAVTYFGPYAAYTYTFPGVRRVRLYASFGLKWQLALYRKKVSTSFSANDSSYSERGKFVTQFFNPYIQIGAYDTWRFHGNFVHYIGLSFNLAPMIYRGTYLGTTATTSESGNIKLNGSYLALVLNHIINSKQIDRYPSLKLYRKATKKANNKRRTNNDRRMNDERRMNVLDRYQH